MRLRSLAASLIVIASVAACGGSAATAVPSQPAGPVRIEVTLTDALKIEPASMTVPAGVPVTFVVTNEGGVLHEFVVGDEEVQAEHEQEMLEAGGMTMAEDEPDAIGVEAGQTKELVMTFETPGTTIAGCHVVGHYGAGMRATITIE